MHRNDRNNDHADTIARPTTAAEREALRFRRLMLARDGISRIMAPPDDHNDNAEAHR